jgi:hypothetical protein
MWEEASCGHMHEEKCHMNTNIALSADEALIRQGRRRAACENTTLQKLFR